MILQLGGSRDNRRHGIAAHHEMNGDPLLWKRLLAHVDDEMIGAVATLMGRSDGWQLGRTNGQHRPPVPIHLQGCDGVDGDLSGKSGAVH